jgi:hypothetical protein
MKANPDCEIGKPCAYVDIGSATRASTSEIPGYSLIAT